MKVHFIIHEVFEAPEAYETWARERRCDFSFTKLYENETLPESIDEFDMLIVMGGPQSPDTTKTECPHFDGEAEIRFIRQCADSGKAIVGVCLGAQLLGEAFGARYEHSLEGEIGKFPITLTEDGLQDPLIAHFGETFDSGHWHNDMPGLTPDSKVLAYSEGCPRQIVRYADFAYGFQCHLEFTKSGIEGLIANSGDALVEPINKRFVQSAAALRNNDYSDMNAKLVTFLDNLAAAYAKGV